MTTIYTSNIAHPYKPVQHSERALLHTSATQGCSRPDSLSREAVYTESHLNYQCSFIVHRACTQLFRHVRYLSTHPFSIMTSAALKYSPAARYMSLQWMHSMYITMIKVHAHTYVCCMVQLHAEEWNRVCTLEQNYCILPIFEVRWSALTIKLYTTPLQNCTEQYK